MDNNTFDDSDVEDNELLEDNSKENEIDGLSLQHVLKLINQPKISDEDACAVYPDTAKVLKNWTLTIRENPVQHFQHYQHLHHFQHFQHFQKFQHALFDA